MLLDVIDTLDVLKACMSLYHREYNCHFK